MKSHSITLAIVIVSSLIGCGAKDKPTSVVSTSTENARPEAPPKKSRGRAHLRLGDKNYDLDKIVCINTAMATATASDSQNRAGYPTIIIRTFDASLTGGTNSDTASVMFNDDGNKQHWKFQQGNIKRGDNTYSAFGFLEGSKMITQEDGTLKSAAPDGESTLAFTMNIECRD